IEPALQPYLKNLYTYMSISGPHLGYWYSSNSLFNSGLWLLKKLKGAQCIHQLTFSDDQDPQNTFFYKLCKVWYHPLLRSVVHSVILSVANLYQILELAISCSLL
ncbi:Os12g0164800, partial [Oryza sativa Japonica Group]